MKHVKAALSFVCVLGYSSLVQALPTQLTFAEFNAAISGLSPVVEKFDGFSVGAKASPFVFANGSVISPMPFITIACSGNCLGNESDQEASRTFSNFPAGATHWGADFFNIIEGNLFNVSVVGRSGSLNLAGITTSEIFFGFQDPQGLISVSFTSVGNGSGGTAGDYVLDNITTAGSAPVTVPAAIAVPTIPLYALMLSALGLLLVAVRRLRTLVRQR